MGLFNKLKQGLGIGTAKVELSETPAQISKGTKEVSGKVTVTAKSDQKVKSIRVALVEKSVSEFNSERRELKKDIAFVKLDGFDLKKDEARTLPFMISLVTGEAVKMEVFGGTLEISSGSAMSSSSLFSPNTYELIAVADLEGVALDPTDAKPLNYF